MLARAVIISLCLFFSAPAFASVACVQDQLTRLGYSVGPIDGLLGGKTAEATKVFAKAVGQEIAPISKETSDLWCATLKTFAASPAAKGYHPFDLETRPDGVLSAQKIQRLWDAYKTAPVCFEHPEFGRHPALRVATSSAKSLGLVEWRSPFTNAKGNKSCLADHPNFNRPPQPIPTVKLDEDYGDRQVEVDLAMSWFRAATTFARLSEDPIARQVLKQAIYDWAKAGSLSEGIHVSWGDRPVDYQMMVMILDLVNATSEISNDLNAEEKAVIGPWLGGLVAEASKSRWKDRQDNKEYMRSYISLIWALLVGDNRAAQDAIDVFKLAVHDVRPDGSFPVDSQRSGMGLDYNANSAGYLVLAAAALKRATGEDLFSYEVDGRSGHNVVDFVVRSMQKPKEINPIYAISCPDGGDRFGTPTNPSLSFIDDSTFLLTYAAMYPDREPSDWILQRFGDGLKEAALSEHSGGAPACQFAETMDASFSVPAIVLEEKAAQAVLPEPEFEVLTREELSHYEGRAFKVGSLWVSVIEGARNGENRLDFNIDGIYNFKNSNFTKLEFAINHPLGKTKPAGLDACGYVKTVTYEDDLHRIVISFAQDGTTFTAKNVDCIVAALPEEAAFVVKFLTDSFRDIAIGVISSGTVDTIQHDGLKDWIEQVAYGKIVVQ